MNCDMYITIKTGSSSDDWIYYQLVTHSLVITLKYRLYSAISRLHQLQFTFAHALGFSVSTSHFPAMDLNAQTVTVSHSKYYTRRKSFSHTLSLLTAMNFPLLLHFTCNCHFQQRTHFRTDSDNSLLWTLVNSLLQTRTELPPVSPINPGVWHAGNAASCTVARDVAGVTWPPPYCCMIQHLQRRLETHGARRSEGGEAWQGERKTSLTTVAQSRFEVSAFQQLLHWMITPNCSLLKAVHPEQPNSVSPFLSSCGLVSSAVITLRPLHPVPP
jgi:hypothetical protein